MRDKIVDTNRDDQQEQPPFQREVDDREMLLGFLALLSLALPALAIRTLLPDLNPFLLAGIGIIAYGAYLGWMFRAVLVQSTVEQAAMEPVRVSERRDHSLSELERRSQ